MLQNSNLTIGTAVANQSGAMKADTISKNGQSLKSQMSRRFILIGIMFCVILSSCSSPEKDGIKAAKMKYNCENDYDVALNKAYVSYIKNFNFETRIDAREKLSEIRQEVEVTYRECEQKVYEKRDKLINKYLTNRDKTEKFEYAFRNAADEYYKKRQNGKPQEKIRANIDKIETIILSIIPPKPDIERIKRDLVGKDIREIQNDIYHRSFTRQGWSWNIKDGEIKDIQIKNEKQLGDSEDYLIDFLLFLQANGGTHKILVSMTYVLRENDDWRVNSLKCKDVNMVKTGKYDNCVTIEKIGETTEIVSESRWDFSVRREYVDRLKFTNNCNENFVVGGEILSGGEWKKFLALVKKPYTTSDYWTVTQQRYTVNTTTVYFSVSFKEYKIHFVELQ